MRLHAFARSIPARAGRGLSPVKQRKLREMPVMSGSGRDASRAGAPCAVKQPAQGCAVTARRRLCARRGGATVKALNAAAALQKGESELWEDPQDARGRMQVAL